MQGATFLGYFCHFNLIDRAIGEGFLDELFGYFIFIDIEYWHDDVLAYL